MSKPKHHQNQKPPQSGRTNLASCVVAAIFLVFVVIVVLIVFFTLFKPQDPKISVNSVQLPTFSVVANTTSTVNFTFSQYVSVKNPNRSSFAHFDSTLQLLYAGNQVGFLFIPAGKINAGGTQYMAATFSVQSFPLSAAGTGAAPENVGPVVTDGSGGLRMGPTLEIESRMKVAGRVRILHFFSHNVGAVSDCRVTVSVSDGSVLGFHC